MKKNWIKGLDRIAILLAIPIAVLGFSFAVKRYSEKNAVNVYYTEKDASKAKKRYEALPEKDEEVEFWSQFRIIDSRKEDKGVLAIGKKGLKKAAEKCYQLEFALDRAIKDGGDPEGTLVNKHTFFGTTDWTKYLVNKDEQHEELWLIPRKSKRYAVGVFGSIGFALITILSVGVTTRGIPRIVRWVRNGFRNDV